MAKQSKPLANVTAAQGDAIAKVIVSTVVRLEKLKVELLKSVSDIAKDFGPITASQYAKQLSPGIKAGLLKAAERNGWAKGTADFYVSRAKVVILAVANKVAEPLAGESFQAFAARVSEPLTAAKLAGGSPVWDTIKTGRKAKAKGASAPKSGGASGSAGTEAHTEGGMNIRPQLAAALILAGQNPGRAERLCIVLESYPEQFDRWAATILTDQDKAELSERVKATTAALQTEPATAATVTGNVSDSLPAVGAALVAAQAKANRKRAKANGARPN